jgi:hypothetical protein
VSGSVWTQGDDERFLAAIAAAILGAQGSPVWSQTAEALLLGDAEVNRHYQIAARLVDAALRES